MSDVASYFIALDPIVQKNIANLKTLAATAKETASVVAASMTAVERSIDKADERAGGGRDSVSGVTGGHGETGGVSVTEVIAEIRKTGGGRG